MLKKFAKKIFPIISHLAVDCTRPVEQTSSPLSSSFLCSHRLLAVACKLGGTIDVLPHIKHTATLSR